MADLPPNHKPSLGGSITNPLEPVAWMLAQVADCLDEAPDGRSPRWVRIAKARTFLDKKPHGSLIKWSVETVLDVVAGLHDTLLDLERGLLYIDPEKAILEWVIAMARAATAPELGAAFTNLTGTDAIARGLADANGALAVPERYLGFIPEPADIRVIGRQICRLLEIGHTDPPGGVPPDASALKDEVPCVDAAKTGRLRLLAWAFDLPVNVKHQPKGGAWTRTAVQRLGCRWRWPGESPGQPATVRDVWPAGDKDGVELYRLDVSTGRDVAEIVQILDSLGYAEPALASPPTTLTPELCARLVVFQRLNDLPDHGQLDTHTLHRLLNLDAATRNVARARPFDEARFKAIPPPPKPERAIVTITREVPVYVTTTGKPTHQGHLDLVNPDADHPDDEGIAIDESKGKPPRGQGQTRPMRFYTAGADPSQGFANGKPRGWLRHRKGGGWMFTEERPMLGDSFFRGMETRPLLKGGKAGEREGGWLSEGASSLGTFFFAARQVEPWVAGRSGKPQADAFAREIPPNGTISAIYQWLDISQIIKDTPNDPKAPQALVFQGSVQIRSLYKDKGAGQLPDQGRIVIGLARGDKMSRGYLTELANDTLCSFAWSGLWPTRQQEDLSEAGTSRMRNEDWVSLVTETLPVPTFPTGAPVTHLYVGLHGVHRANWDTDAYFDNVRVLWWRLPLVEASETATQGEGASRSTATTTPAPSGGTP